MPWGGGFCLKQQKVDYPLISDRDYGKKCMKEEARNGEEFDLEYKTNVTKIQPGCGRQMD